VAAAVVRVENVILHDQTVLEALRSRITSREIPKVVVFTDAIPRDRGGNILRGRLRRQFSDAAG